MESKTKAGFLGYTGICHDALCAVHTDRRNIFGGVTLLFNEKADFCCSDFSSDRVFPVQEQREILGFCCAWIGAVRKFKAYFYFPGHRDFFQAYDDGKYRGRIYLAEPSAWNYKKRVCGLCIPGFSSDFYGAGAPFAALFAVIPIFYPPGILLGASPSMLQRSADQRNLFRDACFPVHR